MTPVSYSCLFSCTGLLKPHQLKGGVAQILPERRISTVTGVTALDVIPNCIAEGIGSRLNAMVYFEWTHHGELKYNAQSVS